MTIWSKGLKTVAVVVAVKGVLGVAAGFLVLMAANHDMHSDVSSLLEVIHADAYGRIAHWLQGAADKVNHHRQEVMFVGFVYGGFKLIEAAGLWFEKRWAEWLVVLSTVLCFVPIELYELWIKVTWLKVGAVILNVIIVAFMAVVLKKTKPVSPHS